MRQIKLNCNYYCNNTRSDHDELDDDLDDDDEETPHDDILFNINC